MSVPAVLVQSESVSCTGQSQRIFRAGARTHSNSPTRIIPVTPRHARRNARPIIFITALDIFTTTSLPLITSRDYHQWLPTVFRLARLQGKAHFNDPLEVTTPFIKRQDTNMRLIWLVTYSQRRRAAWSPHSGVRGASATINAASRRIKLVWYLFSRRRRTADASPDTAHERF